MPNTNTSATTTQSRRTDNLSHLHLVNGEKRVPDAGEYWGPDEPEDNSTNSDGHATKATTRATKRRNRTTGFKGMSSEVFRLLQQSPFRVRRNTFTDETEVNGQPVDDRHYHQITYWLQQHYGKQWTKERVWEGMEHAAATDSCDPVADWLTGITWDGQDNIGKLADLLGATKPIHRTMVRKFLISAVARVLEPGCKVDTIFVLMGAQGSQKSSFFLALCPDQRYFTDCVEWPFEPDECIKLRSAWLVELAEVDAVRKADYSEFKAAISRTTDGYREPYARKTRTWPRHSVFVATTNEFEFLKDPTGNRRFWLLPIDHTEKDPIDLAAVRALRDQVWAQAVAAYRQREVWYMREDEITAVTRQNLHYMESDPWAVPVLEWARGRTLFSTKDVLIEVFHYELGELKKVDEKRVGAILNQAGFKNQGGRRGRHWKNPEVENGQPHTPLLSTEKGHDAYPVPWEEPVEETEQTG